jgi:hypothetical protein
MPSRRDQEFQLEVRPCIGGLNRKFRPALLPPSQSPDLENVLFDRRSIRGREGSVPVARHAAPANAILNRGRAWRASRLGANPTANIGWKAVEGHGVIGHRRFFNAYNTTLEGTALKRTRFTVSFIVTPDPGDSNGNYGLPGYGVNNWNWNSFATDLTNTYEWRPIIAKGPMRGARIRTSPGNEYPSFEISIYRSPDQTAVPGAVWQATVFGASGAKVTLRTPARVPPGSPGVPNPINPRPMHTYRVTLIVNSEDPGYSSPLTSSQG